MKDKYLRELLEEAGIIKKEVTILGNTHLSSINISEKLNAVIEFLEIEIKYDPTPELRAYKKTTSKESTPEKSVLIKHLSAIFKAAVADDCDEECLNYLARTWVANPKGKKKK